MTKQFTPCPACGAVGEIGNRCQFCGTTITLKEGVNPTVTRIVEHRSVTPQQYAERISIYHNVRSSNSSKLMHVCIGCEKGLINLDGELVYPLQHEYDLYAISDSIVFCVNPKKKYITNTGFRIEELGALINLETMEKYEGVERSSEKYWIDGIYKYGWCYYVWENSVCKCRIDPISWEEVGNRDSNRSGSLMTFSEYYDEKERREAEERAEQERCQAEENAKIERYYKWTKAFGILAIVVGGIGIIKFFVSFFTNDDDYSGAILNLFVVAPLIYNIALIRSFKYNKEDMGSRIFWILLNVGVAVFVLYLKSEGKW